MQTMAGIRVLAVAYAVVRSADIFLTNELPGVLERVKIDAGHTRRAPEFNEHGDEILAELGFDQERVLGLEISGAIA